jgi:hypothetical protein
VPLLCVACHGTLASFFHSRCSFVAPCLKVCLLCTTDGFSSRTAQHLLMSLSAQKHADGSKRRKPVSSWSVICDLACTLQGRHGTNIVLLWSTIWCVSRVSHVVHLVRTYLQSLSIMFATSLLLLAHVIVILPCRWTCTSSFLTIASSLQPYSCTLTFWQRGKILRTKEHPIGARPQAQHGIDNESKFLAQVHDHH